MSTIPVQMRFITALLDETGTRLLPASHALGASEVPLAFAPGEELVKKT